MNEKKQSLNTLEIKFSELTDLGNSSESNDSVWIWTKSEDAIVGKNDQNCQLQPPTKSGIWVHLNELAIVWRLFGTFPLQGFASIDGPHFRWCHWITFYSISLLIIGIIAKTIVFKKNIIEQHHDIPHLDIYFHMLRNGFSLTVMALQNTILFIQSKKLPALFKKWHDVDSSLGSLSTETNLKKKSWVIFGILSFFSIATELLSTMTITSSHFGHWNQWSISKWLLYLFIVVGDFIHIHHMYIPISWVCILSTALVKGFRKVQQNITRELDQLNAAIENEIKGEFVEKFRNQYTSMCLLVKMCNDFCSPVILTVCVLLFASICANIYSSVFDISDANSLTLHSGNHIAFAILGVIGLLALIHTGGQVKQSANEMLTVLRRSSISQLPLESQIQMLYWATTASKPLPCLTALGFFELSPEVFITIVGVVVTYVALLIQFRIGLAAASSSGR